MATSTLSNPSGIEFGVGDNPPFLKYFGQSSFFGGTAPLDIVYGKRSMTQYLEEPHVMHLLL
jgi:hypothetical protein